MEFLILVWLIILGVAMTHENAGHYITAGFLILIFLGNAILFFR